MHKQAFTLIELLVVVLIIGILSTLALPQYQKAVMRARVAEYEVNLRALADTDTLYYLANGEYATEDRVNGDLTVTSKLDRQLPDCKLLPGLSSEVKRCSYHLSKINNSAYPSILLWANSYPLNKMFIFPTQGRIEQNGDTNLQPNTMYCQEFGKGTYCVKLGFTQQITSKKSGLTLYYRP